MTRTELRREVRATVWMDDKVVHAGVMVVPVTDRLVAQRLELPFRLTQDGPEMKVELLYQERSIEITAPVEGDHDDNDW